MAALELALPVKVTVLQQMQEQGRSIRAHQREEPDDLQLARQQIEGLLQQIQPEPYKFYERWEILVMHERGNRRTGNVIHDLWRQLPEQTRLGPLSHQRSLFANRECRIADCDLGPLTLQPTARPAPAGSGGAAAPGP
jgi:hypothetical protein